MPVGCRNGIPGPVLRNLGGGGKPGGNVHGSIVWAEPWHLICQYNIIDITIIIVIVIIIDSFVTSVVIVGVVVVVVVVVVVAALVVST